MYVLMDHVYNILYSACINNVSVHIYRHVHIHTVEYSYNKPEIPGQTVRYKQEFVISEQFPMRYCSTWLRSLLRFIKKFVIRRGICYKSVPLYVHTDYAVHVHTLMGWCGSPDVLVIDT